MKKLWAAITFSALLLSSGNTLAQQVESVHFVNLDLLGAHYNYEQPIFNNLTVVGHVGMGGEFSYSTSSWLRQDSWYYSIRGTVGADFRYYYDIYKRERDGKNTDKNAADFFAIDLQYHTPALFSYRMHTPYMVTATPYWGFRRIYYDKLLFEINAGYNLGMLAGTWGGSVKLNFKLGYTF